MSDQPKSPRKERFTMLEPSGPINPSPEELATRVVGIAFKERFTMLEPSGPINPSPEELATRVIEPLINVGPIGPAPPSVPPAVEALAAQLAAQFADAIGTLEPGVRAAAINKAVAELTKRLAG